MTDGGLLANVAPDAASVKMPVTVAVVGFAVADTEKLGAVGVIGSVRSSKLTTSSGPTSRRTGLRSAFAIVGPGAEACRFAFAIVGFLFVFAIVDHLLN